MKEHLYNELIAKSLSGDISAAEQAQLDTWMQEQDTNQADYDASKQVWDAAKSDDTFKVNTDDAWGKFEGKMAWDDTIEENTPTAKVVSLSPMKQLLRIAAVLLVAGGAFWFYQNSMTNGAMATIQTEENERKEVALPDGSKIWLNERSTITYDKAFASRNVTLKGEAFFDIARDEQRPFRIQAAKTETEVLGTSFNIRAYPEESAIEVAVKTGKVSFSENIANLKPLILTKGHKGILDKKDWVLKKETPNNENALSWKTGQLSFDNATMKTIVSDLEKHFDTNISAQNTAILNCHFTGKFSDAKISEILTALSFALDIETNENQNNYTFTGKGCE